MDLHKAGTFEPDKHNVCPRQNNGLILASLKQVLKRQEDMDKRLQVLETSAKLKSESLRKTSRQSKQELTKEEQDFTNRVSKRLELFERYNPPSGNIAKEYAKCFSIDITSLLEIINRLCTKKG